MSFLYDINGFGSPNVIGKDIATVNATVSTCDGYIVGAVCVAPADEVSVTNKAPSQIVFDEIVSRYAFVAQGRGISDNYWLGAIAKCESKGMKLPTKTELAAIYTNACGVSAGTACSTTSVRASKGFAATYYWSATEHSSLYGWALDFGAGFQGGDTKSNENRVRCVK